MKRVSIFLSLIVILLGAAIATLVFTPVGLTLGYQLLRKEFPGELQIESISGSLLNTVRLDGVSYRDPDIVATLDSVEVNWRWRALFEDVIHIKSSTASGLSIQYATPDTADSDTTTQLGPYLPDNLIIDQLTLDKANYRQDDVQISLTDSTLSIDKGVLQLTTGVSYHQPDADSYLSDVTIRLHQQAQAWQIEQLYLTLPNEAPLIASGFIHYDSSMALQLNWQQLHWPLTSDQQPWPIALGTGTADINGTLDDLRFALSTTFINDRLTGHLETQGKLQGSQLELAQLVIETANGNLNGEATLDFKEDLIWRANIVFADLNPEIIETQWPGLLKGQLAISGNLRQQQLKQEIQLRSLSGMLRGYPVNATGKFRHSGDHLNIQQLALQSGRTHITVEGELNQRWQTQWSIASPDLAELYPGAGGSLQASGKLTGPREYPVIQTSFTGKKLRFDDYAIQSISGEAHIDTGEKGNWRAMATAEQLRAGDQQLQQATALLQGQVLQHRLQLNLQQNGIQAQLVAEGTWNNQQWRGQLLKADWQSPRLGDWQLLSPVSNILVDARNARLATSCWQQDTAQLCTDLNYGQETGWSSTVEGRELPLAFAKPWLPEQLELNGTASFNGTLKAGPGSGIPESGNLTLTLPAGNLRYGEQSEDALDYMGGELELTLVQQTLQGKLLFQINPHTELRGDGRITQLLSQSPQLSAQLHGNLDELGLIEPFITQIDQLSGKLSADISFSGSLYQPMLQGQLALTEGRFVIPQTAVAYHDVALTLSSETKRRLAVTGYARSAEQGELRVTGNLLLHETQPWEMRLKLKGKDFLVSDTLETQLRVNPDLQLNIQPYSINLSGDLLIPRARLKPKDYQGAVTPSSDTEFVQQESQAAQTRWKFYSLVTIQLGEDIYFHGYGLQGFFSGSVKIQDEPGLLTRGTGELAIREGIYRAYGQDLNIEIGRLLFNNSPLDSPAIHVRATRTVGSIKAGMQTDGQIRSPSVSLYSSPTMSDSDTLSYILFGRPLNKTSESETATLAQAASAIGLSGGGMFAEHIGEQLGLDEVSVESGETLEETALLVGKYLSPSLYLGYSVGLFEPINTLLLRYRINENWMIETETGAESGGDILYTIER